MNPRISCPVSTCIHTAPGQPSPFIRKPTWHSNQSIGTTRIYPDLPEHKSRDNFPAVFLALSRSHLFPKNLFKKKFLRLVQCQIPFYHYFRRSDSQPLQSQACYPWCKGCYSRRRYRSWPRSSHPR
jgi:hypothetical protein